MNTEQELYAGGKCACKAHLFLIVFVFIFVLQILDILLGYLCVCIQQIFFINFLMPNVMSTDFIGRLVISNNEIPITNCVIRNF